MEKIEENEGKIVGKCRIYFFLHLTLCSQFTRSLFTHESYYFPLLTLSKSMTFNLHFLRGVFLFLSLAKESRAKVKSKSTETEVMV